MRTRSIAAVGVVAGAIVLGGATSAMAIGQGRTYNYTLSGTGFSFPGTSTFYASGTRNGGMSFSGTLRDTNGSDGNAVFVMAKTMGYGWSSRTYTSSSTSVDRWVYDPAATYVNYGQVRACRDRGTLGNDNCSTTSTMYR